MNLHESMSDLFRILREKEEAAPRQDGRDRTSDVDQATPLPRPSVAEPTPKPRSRFSLLAAWRNMWMP
jgi:hypothetical protein